MNKRTAKQYVADIVTAMQDAVEFVDSLSYADYLANKQVRYAVVRCFEIMGEASTQMPDHIKKDFVSMPWHLMRAMRNKMIHEYAGINDEVVFNLAKEKLVPLIIEFETMLDKMPDDRI